MKNTYLAAIALFIIILGASGTLPMLRKRPAPAPEAAAPAQATTTAAAQSFGTYQYECDEHVAFSMTLSSDLNSMTLVPANGGAYPPAATLAKKASASGVRYEGSGVVLTAKGETITLGEGDSAINCSPVNNPDEAPFNFGD